jgi:hypothetical protein
MALKFTDVYCQKKHHFYDRDKWRRTGRFLKVEIDEWDRYDIVTIPTIAQINVFRAVPEEVN